LVADRTAADALASNIPSAGTEHDEKVRKRPVAPAEPKKTKQEFLLMLADRSGKLEYLILNHSVAQQSG
jgi:hypothetical protein